MGRSTPLREETREKNFIVGEDGRGPNIETLCAVLRQGGVAQFLALTATVENPEDLAPRMAVTNCSKHADRGKRRSMTLSRPSKTLDCVGWGGPAFPRA